MHNLAPIVLFVYNRPCHTQQTIKALQKNELAKKSELFIYSDEAKNDNAFDKVREVRKYLKNIEGFKKITIIEREKNWGLANSIIDGVTKIVNEYGKIIVLEDDLITSPYFLKFMNEALEFYQYKKKVWHISGWNYPIDSNGLDDVFLWRLMNCWGWATWADRWQYYEKNSEALLKEFTPKKINYLNLDGITDSWSQVIMNKNKKIDTWAIYWYATIIKNSALCLNPTITYVENIGHDGSGIHCDKNESYKNDLSTKKTVIFSHNLKENDIALKKIKQFYKNQKKSFLIRLKNKILKTVNLKSENEK